MPAGCDFVCENINCDYFNTGFTITGPWPLGDIDEIIYCSKVQSDDSLKNELLSLKDSGEEFARIIFPNEDNIEEKRIRLSFWDSKNLRINYFDIRNDLNKTQWIDRILEINKLSDGMKPYSEVINGNISCPNCNYNLSHNRWIST